MRDGAIVADEKLQTLKDKAPRTVVLRFSSVDAANGCELPEFIDEFSVESDEIHLSLTGAAAEVTRWAAQQSIIDIQIGAPSLDMLFRKYYAEQSSIPEAAS